MKKIKRTEHPRSVVPYQTCINRIPEREKREKGMEGMSEEIMNGQELYKINETQQTTDKRSSRNSKQDKHTHVHTYTDTYIHTHTSLPRHIIVKLPKTKAKHKILKTAGKKHFKKHITIATIFHVCDLIVKNNKTGISNTY